MDGALYRPIATAACGTSAAADDSLHEWIKLVKGVGFQIRQLDRIYKIVSGFTGFHPVHPEGIL